LHINIIIFFSRNFIFAMYSILMSYGFTILFLTFLKIFRNSKNGENFAKIKSTIVKDHLSNNIYFRISSLKFWFRIWHLNFSYMYSNIKRIATILFDKLKIKLREHRDVEIQTIFSYTNICFTSYLEWSGLL